MHFDICEMNGDIDMKYDSIQRPATVYCSIVLRSLLKMITVYYLKVSYHDINSKHK